ncbi:MAG: hypothetical protein C4K60_10275 [Ideonella sp. MAG2]|nr:MAG: hypothetical protein C4K60_10275 [Ideonella sp. MAG2]
MFGSKSSAPAASDKPAEAVALTVHELEPPKMPSQRRGRATMLLVLLACAAPVIVSYFLYYVVRPEPRSNYATLIQPTRGLPAGLPLKTLQGQAVAATSLKGQWLLTVVSSGACDAGCEARLYEQRQLREMMGRERDRVDKLWLITDDAAVPAALLAAVQAQPPVTVLRVSATDLQAWLSTEPGHAFSDHLFLIDPMGEWMMRTPPQPDPMRFKKDLERLLKASAFWDRAGRQP